MTRRAALLSGLLAAVVCAPATLSRDTRAQEQKPQEQKPSEQKAPEKKEKTPEQKPGGGASESKVPPEEAKRPNPVKPDADSIAQGKRFYSTQCAMCHGADGDGKGDLADIMKLKMRDYRDPDALKDFTDGELFYILTNGKDKMPDQGDRMSATQKWNSINFIRSLAKKSPPAKKESPPSQ